MPINVRQKITASKTPFLTAKSYISASFLCSKMNENRRKRKESTVSQSPYETTASPRFLQKEVVMVRTKLRKLNIFPVPQLKNSNFHNGPSSLTYFLVVFLQGSLARTLPTRSYSPLAMHMTAI